MDNDASNSAVVKIEFEEDSMNNVVTPKDISPDSTVTCGKCKESMIFEKYESNHRGIHYNLCWLDGLEDEIDFTDSSKIQTILRKYTSKCKTKLKFKCDWCNEIKQSIIGFTNHLKKCVHNPLFRINDSSLEDSKMSDDTSITHNDDLIVNCACCDKNMSNAEYEKTHKLIHYNLCWINGEEKLDLDDGNVTQKLLRQYVLKSAKKKVLFICEWCQVPKKSVLGFVSHIKRCQLRPDKVALLNKSERSDFMLSDLEITIEKDASLVTCGRCNNEMTFKEYRTKHCPAHYNLCWIVGEEKPDLRNFDTVLNELKKCIPFKAVRNRSVTLTCEDCKSVKKSLSGFASHVIFCNKTASDVELLLLKCEDCGNKIKPSSKSSHKLRCCKVSDDNSINDTTTTIESSCKIRRKRKPPNILTLHPDTKYITEYYDCMCQLCDFITSNVNDIIDHVMTVHNIANKRSLSNYMLTDTYKVTSNIYLKPLLNYYNFYKKTFWTANFHEEFHSNALLLTNDEALKYFPSVQQSCEIFKSDGEKICIDLFESAHVNGMYWLFTGGPNWAMSWCPVPEQVKTQYLAISCHPKPDLEHKEMNIYKYPSLVQLWQFNSLNNINYESINDMPYMSYGLAHEFGAVWDMAWCPSGAYEPDKKLGLLALSTSSGDCPVFAMPFVDGNPKMFFIYKAKPVIARNFECEWIESGVQCTKVCWQAVSPFKTLVCGYSNGNVSVFNINFQSIFLNKDVLFPSHTFKASRSCITGLSINYLNSSILATAATDGNVILWDLKSPENPIFQKKCYSPSDCNWLQQCYTLMCCSKGVNPLFLKFRTVNFSNYDDDVHGYNPELYILKNVSNINKEVFMNDDKKLNYNADETINGEKMYKKSTTCTKSNINSDEESFKSVRLSTDDENDDKSSFDVIKSGDTLKTIDEEDFYGPIFFQKSTHWSVSGSDWMNVIATGDENGVIYEKLFLPETNQIIKGNSTTLQLMVRKLSNNMSKSEFSNCYYFHETIKEFALESKFFPCESNVEIKLDDKPLLRYPLENITKVSWNQNFNSFRWLSIGTQSGFTLISPSRTLPDNCIESFYENISNCNNKKTC